MSPAEIPANEDWWDRLILRAASMLTLALVAGVVFFTLTDLPFDRAARQWRQPDIPAAQDADSQLAQLGAIETLPEFGQLNALSCWYLPYTPHELLAARLNQGGAGAYPRPDCPGREDAEEIIATHEALLQAYDGLLNRETFIQPPLAQSGRLGRSLAAAIALDLGRIALDAAAGPARRRAATGRLAERLHTLRIMAGADLDVSLRAAAMQGMVYILRLAPVLIADDAAAAQDFRTHAGAALAAVDIPKDALVRAMRLHVAIQAGQQALASEILAAGPGDGLMVPKPVLYARLVMDMTRDVLGAYAPDAPAASLNRLRRKVDTPLASPGLVTWLHPVQTAAMEPLLEVDEAALVGLLIDMIQFNELRRMLLINIAALEQGSTGEEMADFVVSQDEGLASTLTGRAFRLDPHAGDLVARPGKDDKLAYTLRLYLGRGGGGIKAETIWPPGRNNNYPSQQATP